MSKLLATLLDQPAANLASLIFNLEKLSGHSGIDVKLSVEVERLARSQIEKLGLDPIDSTGEEIYHSLIAKFENNNLRFTRSLGGRSHHQHRELVPLVVDVIERLKLPSICWAPKNSAIKEIIKQAPPKKIIKLLGYRTVDSFIKREQVEEVLAAAPFVESASWAKSFDRALGKLSTADFEKRPIKIVCLPEERWSSLPRQNAVVGYISSCSTVAIWPINPSKPNALALAVLVMQAMNSLRIVGSWIEFNQVRVSPGKLLAKAVDDRGLASGVTVGGESILWRELISHYAKAKSDLPEALAAQIDSQDIASLSPAVALSKIDHSLSWWMGMEYVGAVHERVLSFNLTDAALNCANRINYYQSGSGWLALNLCEELFSRYFANQWAEDSLLSQLEGA